MSKTQFKFRSNTGQMIDISAWESLDAAVAAAVRCNQLRHDIGDPNRIMLVAALHDNGCSRTLTNAQMIRKKR